jgi:cellobiose PTS system EIIC component
LKPAMAEGRLKSVQERLMPLADRIANNTMLLAIRDGVVATLPLIMLGSLFVLVANPPIASWQKAIAARPDLAAKLALPFVATSKLICLYLAFSLGASLARRKHLDDIQGGLLALAAFLVANQPFSQPNAEGKLEWFLPMKYTGAEGIFIAILLAFLTVGILSFFHKKKWIIRLPATVPPSIAQPFASLIPGLVLILIVWALFHLLSFDLFALLTGVMNPILVKAGDSLPWVLLMVLLDSVLWMTGIHAVVLLAAAKTVWMTLLTNNTAAYAAGITPLPHIAAWPYYNWFVWIGGSGAALPLAFMFLRARSRSLRTVGKLSAPAVLFNINEPLLFGAPIVLNPIFALPFFLAPATCAVLSWLVFKADLITRPFILPPWTLPAPVGAFLATGGDWKAIILVLINIIISGLIYWPFFRAYDRLVAARETAAANAGEACEGN